MRILLISHTCQSASEGQPKADRLARIPAWSCASWCRIDGCTMAPGARPAYRKTASSPARSVRLLMPWVGPAQCYLHCTRAWRAVTHLPARYHRSLGGALGSGERPRLLAARPATAGAKIVSETEQNIDKRLPAPFEQFGHTRFATRISLLGAIAKLWICCGRKATGVPPKWSRTPWTRSCSAHWINWPRAVLLN